MNAKLIAQLQRLQAEMETAVQDQLARHTDQELTELVDAHINRPMQVMELAMMNQSPNVSIMAACMIRRVLLRRLEAKAMNMEATV